jgi:hypothetical protein
MTVPNGKNAMQRLLNWSIRRGWGYELKRGRTKVVDAFRERTEVLGGGIVSDGTATATELMLSMTECDLTILGRMGTIAEVVPDDDFLDAATTGVGQPVYGDGSDASALSLGTDETAKVTLIACNSDGAGAADEDDGGTFLIVALVAGTSSDYADQDSHLSSVEIQAALEASDSVHDGITGWAHLCQMDYADTGGAAWAATVTMNRNNVVSEA